VRKVLSPISERTEEEKGCVWEVAPDGVTSWEVTEEWYVPGNGCISLRVKTPSGEIAYAVTFYENGSPGDVSIDSFTPQVGGKKEREQSFARGGVVWLLVRRGLLPEHYLGVEVWKNL
jgi:hypothetical protein